MCVTPPSTPGHSKVKLPATLFSLLDLFFYIDIPDIVLFFTIVSFLSSPLDCKLYEAGMLPICVPSPAFVCPGSFDNTKYFWEDERSHPRRNQKKKDFKDSKENQI